jgi:cobalt/nickel transport system permease protein
MRALNRGLSTGFAEALPHRNAPLQNLDARVKLILLVILTSAMVTTPIVAWPAFVFYTAIIAAAIHLGGVPISTLAKRLAILLPFLLLSAVFIPFAPALQNAPAGSPTGMLLFANVVVKSTLGAAATMLLMATTPFPKLVAALEALRVPRVAVMIFSFTHRYLFVLGEEALRMKRACESRCYRGRWLRDAVTIGQMAGTLFLRSYERGERVYLAMLSRGFDGSTVPAVYHTRLKGSDYAFLLGMILVIATPWCFARFML